MRFQKNGNSNSVRKKWRYVCIHKRIIREINCDSTAKKKVSRNFQVKNRLGHERDFTAICSILAQKFRQITFLLKNFTVNYSIWRKKILHDWKFVIFPHSQCGKTKNSLSRKFFPSNQFAVKFFSKTLIWRKFCEKTLTVKFLISTLWSSNWMEWTQFWIAKLYSHKNNFVKTN